MRKKSTQAKAFDETAARLKAMKAVKDLGKPPSLPPPLNKGKETNKKLARELVTHGKTTTFKRVRTSKTGKKIHETVTRKSHGRSRTYVGGVKSVKNQGNFPLTFAEYYKWLNGDLGWELIDEKLDVAGSKDIAYSAAEKWTKGDPQSAIAAFKTAKRTENAIIKKQALRANVLDIANEKALKKIANKVKQAEAQVKTIENIHDSVAMQANKEPKARKSWYEDELDVSKRMVAKKQTQERVRKNLDELKDARTEARRNAKSLGSVLQIFKK